MTMRGSIRRRQGRLGPEERQKKREARDQAIVEAIARRAQGPLQLDDLTRVPDEMRDAVESVTGQPWPEFVTAVKQQMEVPDVAGNPQLP